MALAREFAGLQLYLRIATKRSMLRSSNDLPALLLAGGMFGDLLGGLLILSLHHLSGGDQVLNRCFAQEKEQEMKIEVNLKCKCNGAKSMGTDH